MIIKWKKKKWTKSPCLWRANINRNLKRSLKKTIYQCPNFYGNGLINMNRIWGIQMNKMKLEDKSVEELKEMLNLQIEKIKTLYTEKEEIEEKINDFKRRIILNDKKGA